MLGSISALAAASLLASVSPPLATVIQASGAEVEDALIAVRPLSLVGPHTGTPDGSYLFLAEGASIAFLQPMRPDATSAVPSSVLEVEGNFNEPIKRQPIGRLCPQPADLLLDPGFDPATTKTLGDVDYPNILILAAGSNGLWVMDADPSTTVTNRAARVDDSAHHIHDSAPPARLTRPVAASDEDLWPSPALRAPSTNARRVYGPASAWIRSSFLATGRVRRTGGAAS